MAKNDLMTYALIGAGVLAGIYVYNKSKPKTSEYTTESTDSFIPDATPSIIKTDIRQTERTQRVQARQFGRTDRVQARQFGRTDRVQARQFGRTDRTYKRNETKQFRISEKTERLKERLKFRAQRQERRIQERKEIRQSIGNALSKLRLKRKK